MYISFPKLSGTLYIRLLKAHEKFQMGKGIQQTYSFLTKHISVIYLSHQ